jgi:hypothetical protein
MKKYKEAVYYGEFVNGKRHGCGIMIYDNTRLYEGNIPHIQVTGSATTSMGRATSGFPTPVFIRATISTANLRGLGGTAGPMASSTKASG